MLFANFVLIHGPGLIVLYTKLALIGDQSLSLTNLLWLGTIPFIPRDIIKAIGAAIIATSIMPKKAYNGEIDKK